MLRNFALGLLALLLMGPASFGALMLDGMNDGRYELHSAQFQGSSFWVEVQKPDGTRAFRGSGVRINEWYGLTAAHLFELNGESFTNAKIGTGSNYMTNPGETRNVASVGIYPTWDGTLLGTSVDLAWVKFDQPLLGGEDLTIGDLALTDLVTVSGYGRPGTPTQGMLPADGYRRAFDAPAFLFGSSFYSPDYTGLRFAEGSGFPINGKGLSGDSGSGGFNSIGELVSITVAQIGETNTSGSTVAVRLDQFKPWIAANTVVPEPSSVCVLALVFGVLLRSRNGRRFKA